MDLSQQFNPVPKPTNKKPNRGRKKRKQKGVEVYKGVKVPHRKVRAKIKRSEYNEALREWGECCSECLHTRIEMHHVLFRSQNGRGGYRNLHPLCKYHHNLAHRKREFADKLRATHEKRYGKWYWADRYDLWKAGIIENPSQELFKKFMESEEKRCRKNGAKKSGENGKSRSSEMNI